jgi:hypothetical protein
MRRIVTIVLIAVAIPLYAWDIYLLVGGVMGGGSGRPASVETAAPARTHRLATLPVVRYEKKGRSPFLARAPEPEPVVKKAPVRRRVVRTPEPPVDPPRITITGIMWNPTSPMAMLTLPDGSSTVARAGRELTGGIVVKKVDKNAVTVRYKGKEFRIEK